MVVNRCRTLIPAPTMPDIHLKNCECFRNTFGSEIYQSLITCIKGFPEGHIEHERIAYQELGFFPSIKDVFALCDAETTEVLLEAILRQMTELVRTTNHLLI